MKRNKARSPWKKPYLKAYDWRTDGHGGHSAMEAMTSGLSNSEPDFIANNREKYLQYVDNLGNTLGVKREIYYDLTKLAGQHVPSGENEENQWMRSLAEREFKYDFKYTPEGGYNTLPEFPTPTVDQVQKLIDRLKCVCPK